MDLVQVLILLPSALLGLVLHEVAHGVVAYALGDPTAKRMGRLSLNPLRHLDLIGTIFLLVLHFGWAKPVQVNPSYFRKPKRDMLLVALAGPATNLLLAALFGLGVRALGMVEGSFVLSLLRQMFLLGVVINVALAVFNMLPVPPLDGSRLIHALVPDNKEPQYRVFQLWAARALMAVLLLAAITKTPIIGRLLDPPIRFFLSLFAGVGA